MQNKDSFSTSLLKVAAAIGVMVAAVVVLANMETGKASRGIYMLGVIGLELLTVTALFKMVSADGDALLKAAAAVALLIVPIHLLGKMDTDSAWKGILRVGAIIAELALMTKFAGTGLQGKQAFLSMALSVNLLVLAVKSLGRMKLGPIAQGIIGLGMVMAELVIFTRFTKPTQIKGLLTMALAVNLLVLAVKSLSRTAMSCSHLALNASSAAYWPALGHADRHPWNAPSPVWALALAVAACAHGPRTGFKLGNPGIITALYPAFWALYNGLPEPRSQRPAEKPAPVAAPRRRRVITNAVAVLPEPRDDGA